MQEPAFGPTAVETHGFRSARDGGFAPGRMCALAALPRAGMRKPLVRAARLPLQLARG